MLWHGFQKQHTINICYLRFSYTYVSICVSFAWDCSYKNTTDNMLALALTWKPKLNSKLKYRMVTGTGPNKIRGQQMGV